MPPKLTTKNYFPAVLTIDGVEIDVRITRMSNVVYDEFAIGLARWGNPRGSAPATSEAAAAENEATRAWLEDALHRFLTIESGQLEHDNQDVTDGARLLEIYGGRSAVVPQALALINGENVVKESEKKTYKSRLVSLLGFASALPPMDSGPGPDSIAAPVSESVSVGAAAAMVSPSEPWSGTTAP